MDQYHGDDDQDNNHDDHDDQDSNHDYHDDQDGDHDDHHDDQDSDHDHTGGTTINPGKLFRKIHPCVYR